MDRQRGGSDKSGKTRRKGILKSFSVSPVQFGAGEEKEDSLKYPIDKLRTLHIFHSMNIHSLTLTEGEAQAVGFALMSAIREQKARLEKDANDWRAKDLLSRLRSANENLNTCQIKEAA